MNATITYIYNPDLSRPATRPLYLSRVAAGFPSPADDYLERELDLNDYLNEHQAATYYVRVSGYSMVKAGIADGDILVVDRSLTPKDGSIVIAVLDGELTVKRLLRRNGCVQLVPENEQYPIIEVAPEREFIVWGVVSGIVRKLPV